MSDAQLRSILWAMNELGVRDVPSFKNFRSLQDSLRTESGIITHRYKSCLNHIFYVNDIGAILAKVINILLLLIHLADLN